MGREAEIVMLVDLSKQNGLMPGVSTLSATAEYEID